MLYIEQETVLRQGEKGRIGSAEGSFVLGTDQVEENLTFDERTVQDSGVIENSWSMYEGLSPSNQIIHPQAMGLDRIEFEAALKSQKVYKMNISSDSTGKTYALPALLPVDNFPWLQTDFYRQEFEDLDRVYCLGLGLDNESRITEYFVDELAIFLGKKQGTVLAIDAPDAYIDAHTEQIRRLVALKGINLEVKDLGSQTYFSGELTFNDGTQGEAPFENLYSAYSECVKVGEYNRFDEMKPTGVCLKSELKDEDILFWWPIYEKAFQRYQTTQPCRQNLNFRDFYLAMKDDRVYKALAFTDKSEPLSLCFMSSDLRIIPWINANYFRDSSPQKYSDGQIMYFPGICANPSVKGGRRVFEPIILLTNLLYKTGNNIQILFDCCDETKAVVPRIVKGAIKASGIAAANITEVGCHSYRALLPAR